MHQFLTEDTPGHFMTVNVECGRTVMTPITATTVNEPGAGVLFHLDTTVVKPVPSDITVIDVVTLSNSDPDARRSRFAVTGA